MIVLLAILSGAIVSLLACLVSLELLKSRDRTVERLAEHMLQSLKDREATIGLTAEMRSTKETLELLNATTGHIFQQVRKQSMERPMQVGEVAPGGPAMKPLRPLPTTPTPPDGLDPGDPTDNRPVGQKVRERAFGEPT